MGMGRNGDVKSHLYSEYIVGAGPGRFWVLSTQERQVESQAKFCFLLSGKQSMISLIFSRPNLTKCKNKSAIGVVTKTFRNNCENFTIRGRFSKKRKKISNFLTFYDTRPP